MNGGTAAELPRSRCFWYNIRMKGILFSALAASLTLSLSGKDGPGTYFDPPAGTANVAKQVSAKPGALKKTVAFLGGSITEMDGFRPRVMRLLREKYPQIAFTEIAAGLSSTCSDAGAYRLEEDMLSKGVPDLFIVEAAVNDDQDGHFDFQRCVRGLEGSVRHVLERNSACAVVVGLMVNRSQYGDLKRGTVPISYAAHARVARWYGAAVANVGAALVESEKRGGMSWAEYADCHPSPAGCDFAAKVVMDAVEQVFKPTEPVEVRTLPRPMDPRSYFRGMALPAERIKLGGGWQVSRPNWDRIPGNKRGYFTQGPAIWSETDGAELEFSFRGTAAALFLTAGPDAGDLKVSVDGGAVRKLALRADWLPLHYPYVHTIDDNLGDGPHTVRLWVSAIRRDGKLCSAVRIHRIYVNGTAE